jgi:hypothetical protein
MDDFIAELERNINKVGTDVIWKRKIGSTTLWLSPITLMGQERVTEILSNADEIGTALVHETKRMTLANSIVGINDLDLREYRDAGPCLPGVGKDGKPTKLTLDKYLHSKLAGWSAQFIDDSFSILADLMESLQKEHLKEISFENAKDSIEELKELEARVADLREQLGKPPLVEASEVSASSMTPPISEPAKTAPVTEVAFDPFAKFAATQTPQPTPESVKPAVFPPAPTASDDVIEPRSNQPDPQVVLNPAANLNPRYMPTKG